MNQNQTNLIKQTIELALEKHNCYICQEALDYFVELWKNLYGYERLDLISRYVSILEFEFKMSDDGWNVDKKNIKDLEEHFIEPDYQVWIELKDRPDLVLNLKEKAQEPLSLKDPQMEEVFKAKNKYKSWQRMTQIN